MIDAGNVAAQLPRDRDFAASLPRAVHARRLHEREVPRTCLLAGRLLSGVDHMRIALASLVLVTACSAAPGDDPASDATNPGPDASRAVDTEWLPGVFATSLATDDRFLYIGSDTLSRVSLSGGASEALYSCAPPADPQVPVICRIETIIVGPSDIVFVQSRQEVQAQTTERTLIRIPIAGGAPTTLGTSLDPRSYLGVTIVGADVYYSTFTAIYQVPVVGGATKFIAQSPNTVRYWIFSPTVIGDNLVWVEGAALYTIPVGRTGKGTLLAPLPLPGKIIRDEDATTLVLALASQDAPDEFLEIDRTSGAALGAPIQIGRFAQEMIATESDVWSATLGGVLRSPRGGGAPEVVTTTPALVLAASSDAVFTAMNTGIVRIAR